MVKNGIPFDVAFQIDPVMRSAFAIVFSEQESGEKFNWNTWRFE